MNRKLTLFFVLMFVGCADLCVADIFDSRYNAWRKYVLEFGNYGGMELSGNEAQALAGIGPNITYKLLTKIRTEENIHMQWALQMLVRKVSGIAFPNLISTPEELMQNRDLVRQWEKDQFLEKGLHLNELLGNFKQQYRQGKYTGRTFLDIMKSNEIRSISSRGIFALPLCIQAVRDKNSAEMFGVYLNVARRSSDYDIFYKDPVATFARKEQKIEYIVKWWAIEKERYSELSVLYRRIDSLVMEIEKILKEEPEGGT